MISIVIVDDSPTARRHLRDALEFDPHIVVLGEAATGTEAMRLVKRLNPDLVTMDIFLKDENGLDVAADIMGTTPKPIIAVTSADDRDRGLIYRAMEVGMMEVFPKLPAATDPAFREERTRLLRMVRALSTVPVATRWTTMRRKRQESTQTDTPSSERSAPRPEPAGQQGTLGSGPEILLIGASTGGPPILAELIKALPRPLVVPIVVVQHISEGFGPGFTNWLGNVVGLPTVAVNGPVSLSPGKVYVAPDNMNVVLSSRHGLDVAPARPADTISPCIDALFESAARHFGSAAIGVLLTGMGKDGAVGLKALKDKGARTIVQSPETCAVGSMPGAAIALNAAGSVMSPPEIADALKRLPGNHSNKNLSMQDEIPSSATLPQRRRGYP